MSTQPPTADHIAEFERDVDAAAAEILEQLEWLGLPDGMQLEDLHVELSDAIGKVLKIWL